MLRACVLDFKGNWSDRLPLIEFSYNNSFQSSIKMTPYEALYDRPWRSPLCWIEVGESSIIGPELIQETTKKIKTICGRLVTAQGKQKSYTDNRRRVLEFQEGDFVFIEVVPRKQVMRFGKKRIVITTLYWPF